MLTGSVLVLRPQPNPTRAKKDWPKSYFEILLPLNVGLVTYIVAGIILAGHGINGKVLLQQAWFQATASDGADQWSYATYPAPWDDLPQFLSKEGGAMWFSMAPHQLAHLDLNKYTRFLQHRFSVVNLIPEDPEPISSFEHYESYIPVNPRESAWRSNALGASGYLNIFRVLDYYPTQIWSTMAYTGRYVVNMVLRSEYLAPDGKDEIEPMISEIYRPDLSKTWQKDEEFGRQTIIGANPMSIKWAKDGKLPAVFNLKAPPPLLILAYTLNPNPNLVYRH